MKRRSYLKALGVSSIIANTSTYSAFASPTGQRSTNKATHVDAPAEYVPELSEPIVDLSANLTNRDLEGYLTYLTQDDDRVQLTSIGRSAGLNLPLWEVTIGEGDTNLHVVGTMDGGGEQSGTHAIVLILRQLLRSDLEIYDEILNNLTITFIPQVNPDGAMFSLDLDEDDAPERVGRSPYNKQLWLPSDSRHEPWYYAAPPGEFPGYDLNRDYNINVGFSASDPGPPADWWEKVGTEGGYNGYEPWQLNMRHKGYILRASGLELAPETRAVKESFLAADPDYAITLHHQGIPTVPNTDPPQPSVMSIMAAWGPSIEQRSPRYDPDAPIQANVNPFIDEETSKRSLRMNRLVNDAVAQNGPWRVFDSVTRYGYATLWGSYLDTLCPQTDAAGMLYEISGAQTDIGSRAHGLKIEVQRIGILSTFAALANDPTLSAVDASDYFAIPAKGPAYEEVTQSDK
jgi:hypothetical protein